MLSKTLLHFQVWEPTVQNWQKSDAFDRTIDLSSLGLDFNDVIIINNVSRTNFNDVIIINNVSRTNFNNVNIINNVSKTLGLFVILRCLISFCLQKESLSSLSSVLAFKL